MKLPRDEEIGLPDYLPELKWEDLPKRLGEHIEIADRAEIILKPWNPDIRRRELAYVFGIDYDSRCLRLARSVVRRGNKLYGYLKFFGRAADTVPLDKIERYISLSLDLQEGQRK